MIAFLPTLGPQELCQLLVIGLLLYAHELPEAGRSLGPSGRANDARITLSSGDRRTSGPGAPHRDMLPAS